MANTNPPLQAVILAAGQGTRMKSNLPKVLHDVLGKSIVERVIDSVAACSVEKIHLILGHGNKQISEHLQSLDLNLPYESHIQEPQLGTGHALMQAQDSLKGFQGNLIVTVGDAPLLKAKTLKELVDKHVEESAAITILTACLEDPKSYGRIVRDSDNNVSKVVEVKDATKEELEINEINSAIYCFDWQLVEAGLKDLKCDNKQKEYYLTDLVAWARAKSMKVCAVIAENWWEVSGVNSRIDLVEVIDSLNKEKLKELALQDGVTIVDPGSTWIAPEVTIGKDSIVYPGCQLTGSITIGENSNIGPGSTIKGNVTIGDACTVLHSYVTDSVIGSNCRIGPYAHVREGNTLADKVRVGNFVELKKTSVGSSTNVSHLSYVGDTILGSNANIGAGTITANYDHITKIKSRTTIGDGASTGSNSVIVAPVSLGADCFVAAGTVVTKDVPEGALVVSRSKQIQKEGWSGKRRESHTAKVSS